jgi:hypothetical protein
VTAETIISLIALAGVAVWVVLAVVILGSERDE